ncbi:formylglycine-generating enzyme family protein [Mangrovitalea sediminis]|uniref:formylglycine-generating enzyme family protein n=1 Tax=Mangrovitalea sediminis TaxID=1982043 RepID=UPI000BE60BF5|nr:formylglycine-generating enzyme family protein [Mangrovitalea sediminis]
MTTPDRQAGWHWPHFEQPLCGAVSDRQRLGLPERFQPTRFESEWPAAVERLRYSSRETWLNALQDTRCPLLERLVAGRLLALSGDPRIRTDQPDMVTIAGAVTRIGLPAEEVEDVLSRFGGLGLQTHWIVKECPRHEVRLNAYALARFPVTNAEYRDFLVDSGYEEIPTSWVFGRYPHERANHPVYTVSPLAAQAYADWLSGRTGRRFRLPTEAEWEFAAAGPEGLEFPWGDAYEADCANTAETGLFDSSPVGAFPTGISPFGIADMAGNVEEFVADRYAPYPGGQAITDHLTEIHGTYQVARGGSFARFRDLARTRRRHGHNPRSATYAMGFRLAEDVSPLAAPSGD